MNVVGLISGGKDSIYNLVCCQREGHNIIALAHLIPKNRLDETDSYMYQSIGFDLIPSIAECMNLPLIQHEIQRSPENIKDVNYTFTENDEVEDLYELLKEVKFKFPAVEAVSCGAIASTYQKKRLEHVCTRLNLTILAYLWGRDQKELLEEMISNHMKAIIIKTAAYGLNKDVIGKSIDELYEHLDMLREKNGLNMCGEGGEYETITLDCTLYKKNIILKDFKIITHEEDLLAPVFLLKPIKWELKEKMEHR